MISSFDFKYFFTAVSQQASHPIPQIVSVGYKIIPPDFNTPTAFFISLFNF